MGGGEHRQGQADLSEQRRRWTRMPSPSAVVPPGRGDAPGPRRAAPPRVAPARCRCASGSSPGSGDQPRRHRRPGVGPQDRVCRLLASRARRSRSRAGPAPRGGRRARGRRSAAAAAARGRARTRPAGPRARRACTSVMSHSSPAWPCSATQHPEGQVQGAVGGVRRRRADVRAHQLGRHEQRGPALDLRVRSSASLQSLVQIRSVRARTPRSTRAPPLEQDSISRSGCAARSRSSRA